VNNQATGAGAKEGTLEALLNQAEVKNRCSGLFRYRDFQQVQAHRFHNRQMTVVKLSALRTGRLYTPDNIHGTIFC
jgi:hypothetical protein